ncbi:LacI family DNA-binding transcriptional regulator [Actinomyces faecalis]|uniref:LacI family DNA-binding transcriptional regulator n=1 Tax=Actinomyces faecalis TaxID=2722820 RepID=UPI0015557BD4|nr:LacI family DNA-binding transcriptional regulator [Actinomyces faecalis]
MSFNQLSVTMAAVAQDAGVSRATASRVLNGDTRVDPTAARRVRQSAARMGYVRNAAAAQLARRRSGLIGLLLRDATIPSYAYLQQALITCAHERGLFLVTVSTGIAEEIEGQDVTETDQLLRFLELRPAGIIVASGMIPAKNVAAIAAQVPTVVVPRPESDENLYNVAYDERANARMIVDLVIQRGHRRVGVVFNTPERSRTEFARATAMESALQARGIDVLPIHGAALIHDPDALAHRIAADVRGGAYTCVMFANDVRGVRFVVQARKIGLDVPGEVSVTGMDGLGIDVELADLATVRNPIEETALTAIEVLEDLIAGREVARRHYCVGTLRDGRTLADRTREAAGSRPPLVDVAQGR